MKKNLREETERKPEKKRKKLLREKFEASSDKEDKDLSLTSNSDNDNAWIPEAERIRFKELDKDLEVDAFVLGKVVEIKKSTQEVEVNFLRNSIKFRRYFIFPIIPDITIAPLTSHKMTFTPPALLGNSRRLQSFHKFEVSYMR